jgi:hypothetical protein
MDKGQGLPMSFIVIAAIAALVLVLVIAFTVGGFGTFFGKIFGGGEEAIGKDIDLIRGTCNNLCETAKSIQFTSQWETSSYCSRTFSVDLDRDGQIGGYTEAGVSAAETEEGPFTFNSFNEQEVNLYCYDNSIGIGCRAQISSPSGLISLSQEDCQNE